VRGYIRGMKLTLLSALFAIFACALTACASASSSGSSIVGEWSTSSTTGSGSGRWFFNADGSCGLVLTQNSLSVCSDNCKYTFSGNTLLITISQTTGTVTSNTSYNETVDFGSGGTSATVTQNCDSGACAAAMFTRINSSSSNACP
jgi:hypothetical protein